MKRYRFRSSRSNGEKATVAGGWGSLGRSYGGYFTHKSLESDMEKYSKLVLLRFCVFMRVVTLPAYRFVVGCKTWNVERTGTLEWTMEWIMEWTRQAKFTIVKRPQKNAQTGEGRY